MITSKKIAEKVHMLYNLLFHLDDYIKNKKERRGQLRVSKNIRLILREIISSKINLNYFINKEELDSYRDLISKKNDEKFEIEKKYIKKINPLSFNQKNLKTINLFYNSSNEINILNYIILEKLLSIISFCFIQITKQKHKESIANFEKKYKNHFYLNSEDFDNDADEDQKYEEKKFIKKNLKYNIKNRNYGLNNRNLKVNIDKTNLNNINISGLIRNNFNLNNILSSPNRNMINKTSNNSLNNLRIQINKINNQMNLSLIKSKKNKILSPKNLKNHSSLPLIIDNKRICFSNEKNNINKNNNFKFLKDNTIYNKKYNYLLYLSKHNALNINSISNKYKKIKTIDNNQSNSKDFDYQNFLSNNNNNNISKINSEK